MEQHATVSSVRLVFTAKVKTKNVKKRELVFTASKVLKKGPG
jgi:hypothetical protein